MRITPYHLLAKAMYDDVLVHHIARDQVLGLFDNPPFCLNRSLVSITISRIQLDSIKDIEP